MSDQLTSQSRPSSGISRRTALRGAAWSASAVTVVVATPNIAAATPGTAIVPSGTVDCSTPVKYGESVKYVDWDIFVTCDNMELKGLQLQLTYDQNGGGNSAKLSTVEVQSFSPASSWSSAITKETMIATVSATHAGPDVARGVTASIHVRFQGTDNSKGQVGATVMARDSRGNLVSIGTIAPKYWDAGSEHTH